MLRLAPTSLTAAALAAALAAPAAAQDPPAPAQPAPVQAGGHLKVVPERVGGSPARVLAGARWRVRGVAEPFVDGQEAVVRFTRGGRVLRAKRVKLLRSSTGRSGYFVVSFETSVPGRVVVSATKPETPQQVQLQANAKTVDVLPLRARPGSRGRAVRELQRQLGRLGYVVGAPGRFDARTARAVLAFRKVLGMRRTSEASAEVFRRLARGQGAFRVRFPRHGRHIEADLSRQVIALIDRGRVQRIYPTSTGSPATPTIRGSFRVYRKSPGSNALGMYFSAYFIRGYAIHGYRSVPVYPASHGCLRVPIPDAISIYNWVRMGTRVDVYP